LRKLALKTFRHIGDGLITVQRLPKTPNQIKTQKDRRKTTQPQNQSKKIKEALEVKVLK
jgi:hypothetical protein